MRDLNKSDISALDIRVTDTLLALGIHASCMGYNYLRCSVLLTYHSPEIACYTTKTLYPLVARICHASGASSVERTCRHAIEKACSGKSADRLCEYFGYDVKLRHPTCAQFITTIASRLREEQL